MFSQLSSNSLASKTVSENMAATAAAMDMANLMSTYNSAASMSPLFPPLLPMPGLLGNGQPMPHVQNLMKDFYEQSLKKYMGM